MAKEESNIKGEKTGFFRSIWNGIKNWWNQKTNAYGYNSQLQEEEYEQNLALQQQQQEYEEYMSNTEYQRQVADMKAAGINVGAIGGSGGGASTAGGTGLSTQTPASRKAETGQNETDNELVNALINQTIIDFIQDHKNEIADEIPKDTKRFETRAQEAMRYGSS